MDNENPNSTNIDGVQPPEEPKPDMIEPEIPPAQPQPPMNTPVVENKRADAEPKAKDDNITINIEEPRGPGVIVLQWLTYASWGLTLIALSTLSAMVLTYFMIKNSDIGDFPLYSMAAVLVLLPIAVVCDLMYIKKEPEHKTGAASAVMVVHAVIYALLAISSFITVIFSLVSSAIGLSDSDMTKVVMYSALLITVLFALLFVRVVAPPALFKFRKPFVILMVLIMGVVFAFGLFGPFKSAIETRNDRLIENNISTVVDGVSSYAYKNKKLPSSLSDLDLSGGAKKLVDEKLVTYKQDSFTTSMSSTYSRYYPYEASYYYQLCVEYKKEKKSPYYSSYSYYKDDSTSYSTYISTYTHPAGKKCYKLQTSRYGGIEPVSNGSDGTSSSSDGAQSSSSSSGSSDTSVNR